LAGDIGLKNIGLVGNKIRGPRDREFLLGKMPGLPFLGFIDYDPKVVEADLSGTPPYQGNPVFLQSMGGIVDQLLL
jgi:CO dehydrogenase maturation factor